MNIRRPDRADCARTSGLANLPLLVAAGCAVLPFIAVHTAYLLAADAGQVPWCNPYFDSCTSISATGRRPPASFVFKGVMLPSAMLIAVFWWLQWRWLHAAGGRAAQLLWMLGLGWLACLGLALYVIVLGEVGDWLRLQRKIGTILFFSFTFLAQLLLAAELRRIPAAGMAVAGREAARAASFGHAMLRTCFLMLCIGVLSVIIQAISEPWHDAVEDAIEWSLALLLQVNFLIVALLWRRPPADLRFHTST
jgi:hypothetical protein